jgi:hypothetical protein
MDIKRITFERTGGFAGMRIAADFELDDLPEEQAEQLREMLDGVDFDELPENLMKGNPVPDGFTYSITVESDKGQHTITTSDASAPAKMQPLLELLYQIARQRARMK